MAIQPQYASLEAVVNEHKAAAVFIAVVFFVGAVILTSTNLETNTKEITAEFNYRSPSSEVDIRTEITLYFIGRDESFVIPMPSDKKSQEVWDTALALKPDTPDQWVKITYEQMSRVSNVWHVKHLEILK